MLDLTWREIAMWLGALFGVVLAWFAKVLWDRVDSKAERAELLEFAQEQRLRDQEARDTRQLLFAKLDETNRQVTATRVAVGRIQGELGIGPESHHDS